MNIDYKIYKLLRMLKKIYNTNNWIIYNFEEEHIYVFYRNRKIIRVRHKSALEPIGKFVALCIVEFPETFDIKRILCKIRKKTTHRPNTSQKVSPE